MDYAEMKLEVTSAISLIEMLLDDMEYSHRLVEKEIEDIKKSCAMIDDRLLEARLQPVLRIMTRTAFAAIEGLCYKTKNLSLHLCDHRGIPVTQAEREDVLEKITNKDGKTINHYPETKENIKQALNMLYRAFGFKFEITEHDKWKKLCIAIDVRNRITHPKNIAEMEISGTEYRDEAEGFEWFTRSWKGVLTLLKKSDNLK